MNYIGSKLSLLDFIKNSILEVLNERGEVKSLSDMVFGDGFAGTGTVGEKFKKEGCLVLANDIQYYSYVMNRHYIENSDNILLSNKEEIFSALNTLVGTKGFIYNNYTAEGTKNGKFVRKYFTEENAMLCDAVRNKLNEWRDNSKINDDEYFYLLACLVNAIDKVANTASVYGAFLKNIKKTAAKKMVLTPLNLIHSDKKNKAFNMKIEEWIEEVSGDILYLDPPYNQRQYCTNYHLLETIAKNDNPVIYGKTGLREYKEQKSDWCSSPKVETVFEELIKKAKFKYIFLSYNNEGLMSIDTIKKIMEKYGDYQLKTTEYKRFKADNQRENKANKTIEYLHCLTKTF